MRSLLALLASPLLLLGLTGSLIQPPAAAVSLQSLRATFPGRRVGGGTRADCGARLLIHLVPGSSTYALDDNRLLAVLEGSTDQPKPLRVSLTTVQGEPSASLTLPASQATLSLFAIPKIRTPAIWKSSYECPAETSSPQTIDESLSSASPAPVSLLLDQATNEDTATQAFLFGLRRLCGSRVLVAELVRSFKLRELDLTVWPTTIPVRCVF